MCRFQFINWDIVCQKCIFKVTILWLRNDILNTDSGRYGGVILHKNADNLFWFAELCLSSRGFLRDPLSFDVQRCIFNDWNQKCFYKQRLIFIVHFSVLHHFLGLLRMFVFFIIVYFVFIDIHFLLNIWVKSYKWHQSSPTLLHVVTFLLEVRRLSTISLHVVPKW